ncbi:MAG: hypothetical protein DLM68_02175 [Hyphomicrobiales bacterium]|nr:MAG: hypothetical protein DLM68_02175 [Hyphomicrobiales bacterium]
MRGHLARVRKNAVVVALANKLARIAWAMPHKTASLRGWNSPPAGGFIGRMAIALKWVWLAGAAPAKAVNMKARRCPVDPSLRRPYLSDRLGSDCYAIKLRLTESLASSAHRNSRRQDPWRYVRRKQERSGLQLRNRLKRSKRASPFHFAPQQWRASLR